MQPRSPTLEGFRAIFRRPSFGFAEISWRWSFGAACWLLLAVSFFEYLNTLPVTRLDLLLLKTRQPTLVSQAISRIFRGSGWRALETMIGLALALALGWIVLAAIARAATVKALLAYFREQVPAPSDMLQPPKSGWNWRLPSLFGLNFFRAGATLAATLGCIAAFVLGAIASPTRSPGSGFLIFLCTAILVWLAWSALNWFLSLASIFVVADGQDTFGAVSAAVGLCRTRAGPVFAAGTWFGLAHLAAFVLATSLVAFPLGLAGVLPGGVILGGVLLVTLLYFAVADFLYMGRLAAYVAIIEFPPLPVATKTAIPASPASTQPSALSLQSQTGVDPDELILSDVPAQS
jgi:hypothetical protein